MGEKEPFEDDRVTHTMCKECSEHFTKQWSGLKLGRYLDDFDAPVIAVDEDGRLVAANQQMADMLGKPQREVAGFLGGEAMECVFARLPEGCGRTIHCKTCTIRKNVMATMETGESHVRVPAHLDRDDGRIHFLISTHKKDTFIQLVIEEVVGRVQRGGETKAEP